MKSLFPVVLLLFSIRAAPVAAQIVLVNEVPVFDCSTGEAAGDVPPAGDAEIIRLVGDDPELMDCYHRALGRVVESLVQRDGFDVLLMPVGYYEARVLAAELESNSPPYAAETVYRVWRNSEGFQDLLEMISRLQDEGLFLAGGLVRFHAAALSRYPNEMIAWLRGRGPETGAYARTVDQAASLLQSRRRLRDAPAADRTQLFDALTTLEPSLTDSTEAGHIFSTFVRFVELERIRAGDLPSEGFSRKEKRTNLDWLESTRPSARLIYWEGRGEEDDPLPTERTVMDFEFATRQN